MTISNILSLLVIELTQLTLEAANRHVVLVHSNKNAALEFSLSTETRLEKISFMLVLTKALLQVPT